MPTKQKAKTMEAALLMSSQAKSSWNMAYLNVHCIFRKEESIERYMAKNNLDILFISETWLKQDQTIKLNNIFLDLRIPTNKSHGEGGILGIAATRTIQKNIKILESDTNCQWSILSLANVIIAVTYFSPSKPHHHMRTFWTKLQHHTNQGTKECLLFGDFNTRLGDITEDTTHGPTARVDIIDDWMANPNWILCKPEQGKWTYTSSIGRSVVDHLFTTRSAFPILTNYEVEEVPKGIISDHGVLKFQIHAQQILYKTFNRINVQKLQKPQTIAKYIEELSKKKS